MPPRPFPLPLRVGVDICRVPRILSIIASSEQQPHELNAKKVASFTRRLLTARESQYFKALHLDPNGENSGGGARAATFLAGRWAAKEACIKAVKPRKLTPHEIEIWPESNSETYAIVLDAQLCETKSQGPASTMYESGEDQQSNGKGAQANSIDLVPSHENISGQVARLSISHDGDYAIAIALIMAELGSDHPTSKAAIP